MDVNLEPVATLELSESQRRFFNSIKTSLQSPLDPGPKVQKLAGDIQLLCDEADSPPVLSGMLEELWELLMEVVHLLPPNHPWQDIIVGAVKNLRARDGEVKSSYKAPLSEFNSGYVILWKDLPGLSVCLSSQWQSIYPMTDSDAKPSYKDMDRWINFNSFVARLTSEDFAPWLEFPIWELRNALEEPPLKGAMMKCKLYAASEWILQCGDVVLLELSSDEALSEKLAYALATGPLCLDTPPMSLKRWAFWKSRFLEIGASRKTLGLDDAISGRIVDTLYHMTVVEEQKSQ